MRVLLTPRMAVSVKRRLAEQNNKAGRVTLAQIRGAVTVMSLLGTGWVFGSLAIGEAKLVFSYLFTVTNSLQGFIIFMVRCVQYPEARKAWVEFFSKGTIRGFRRPHARRFESWMFKDPSSSSSKENGHYQSHRISRVGGSGPDRKHSSDSASTNMTNMSSQNAKERLLRTCDEIMASSRGITAACQIVDCDCKKKYPRQLSFGCQTGDFACWFGVSAGQNIINAPSIQGCLAVSLLT